MRSLARNESTTASKRTIQRDMNGEISDATIDSYASILSRLFLLSNQLPFSPSIRSSLRLKQMEKRHFTDPSIAAALLGMNQSSLLNDLQTFGFLFEALVERDLSIYAAASGNMLRHYQDYRGNEVDAIIEAYNILQSDYSAIRSDKTWGGGYNLNTGTSPFVPRSVTCAKPATREVNTGKEL